MLKDKFFHSRLFYSLPYEFRRTLYAKLDRVEFRHEQGLRTFVNKEDYSYKPFDDLKCIFVHIPKTAGVSVCKTLFGNLAGGHTPIKVYQLIFSKIEFDRYFKFTYVRNPWNRVFSAYNYLKKGGMNEQDRKWAMENLTPYNSFEDFIERGLQKPGIKNWVHFIDQHKFLCDPYTQKMLVDFVGFYENLHEDFDYIKKKLLGNVNMTLPLANKSKPENNPDYRPFYTKRMQDVVAQIYKRDLDLFGYNFDNSSLKAQISKRPNWAATDGAAEQ